MVRPIILCCSSLLISEASSDAGREEVQEDIFGFAAGSWRAPLGKQILASLLSLALLVASWPQNPSAYQNAQAPAQDLQRRLGGPRRRPHTRNRLPTSCSSW